MSSVETDVRLFIATLSILNVKLRNAPTSDFVRLIRGEMEIEKKYGEFFPNNTS